MDRRFSVRYEGLMADAEVKPEALEGVLERLREFVQPFAATWSMSQRDHLQEYVAGLVSNVKRKNIESIAYLHEQDRQPLQKFIGQKPWEWRTVKYEWLYLHDYATPRALQAGLAGFFLFYNAERLHAALDYLTPTVIYAAA